MGNHDAEELSASAVASKADVGVRLSVEFQGLMFQ